MQWSRSSWRRFRALPRWIQLGAAVVVIVIVVVALGSEGDEAGQPQVIAEAPAAADEVAPEAAEQPAADEGAGGDATPLEDAAQAEDEAPSPEPVAAEIIRVDDVSFGNVVRLVVRAVVAYPISEADARAVLDRLVAEAAAEPLNAVSVDLYDHVFFVDGAFTVAQAEFAPGGIWGDADTVAAGDYASHATVYQFRPKLADPTRALADRPSPAEREACAGFAAARTILDDPDAADLAIAIAASAETGISVDVIRDAALRCALWPQR